jgi:hypothetical protein
MLGWVNQRALRRYLGKFSGLDFDRQAVWCAVGAVIPGVAMAVAYAQRRNVCHTIPAKSYG